MRSRNVLLLSVGQAFGSAGISMMVLLGGIQTLAGPVVGAVTFTWLHDTVARNTDYWRAMLGAIILILVLLFPQGIAGFAKQLFERKRGADLPSIPLGEGAKP